LADEFTLTPQPVRVTATGKQLIREALDVSAYDQADVLPFVAALEGTTPSVTVRIITGMQVASEDGWVVAGTFSAVTAGNTPLKISCPGLLKFLRWEVSAISGSGAAAAFTVSGMLRRN
jgi:hypothetical protein